MERRSWRIASLAVIGAGIAIAVASEDLRAQLRVVSVMEPAPAVSPSSFCYRETTTWPTRPGIVQESEVSWFGSSPAGRQLAKQFLEDAGLSSDDLDALQDDFVWVAPKYLPQSGTEPMVHRELVFVCYPERMPAVSRVEGGLLPHWPHPWRELFDSQ